MKQVLIEIKVNLAVNVAVVYYYRENVFGKLTK